MFHRVPERTMHSVKWLFALGWIILIFSLFYDPISAYLTEPSTSWSFLRLDPIYLDPEQCRSALTVQGSCVHEQPYAVGAKVFWGMVIPCAIMVILVLGHETWRRICPLSFLSQIPRALGRQRQRKRTNPKTGKVRLELAKINKDSWLGRNHLYFQFGFLFVGLCVRILFINSNRLFLGIWFLLTIIAAITVGYLYAGKSWCQYFCPMAPVQGVYTGPRALLGSMAHQGKKQGTTQSMCRTVDAKGNEKSACVSCQSPCIDIDAERHYWDALNKPGRSLVQYGYLGLVAGFYLYYALYSGTLKYYYSGVWNHEEDQLAQLLSPGFYLFDQAIPIPKIVAVPLTLGTFVGLSYLICSKLEKAYRSYRLRHQKPLDKQQVRHLLFSFCTFAVFNIYYMFGGRPVLKLILPPVGELAFNAVVAIVSVLWLSRTLSRSAGAYSRESLANSLRRQLGKLEIDFSQFLDGRSIEELKADEVYVLAQVLPSFKDKSRFQVYKGLLREQLEQGNVTSAESFESLKTIRLELNVHEEEHFEILSELGIENPDLLNPNKQVSREDQLRIDSYRQALEEKLVDLLESGMPLQTALQLQRKDIKILKQEYSITPEEEEHLLEQMDDENSCILKKSELFLEQLKTLTVNRQVLTNLVPNPNAPAYILLRNVAIVQRQQWLIQELLEIVEILGNRPEALDIVKRIKLFADPLLPSLLQNSIGKDSWRRRLNEDSLSLLSSTEPHDVLSQVEQGIEPLRDDEPTVLMVNGEPIPKTFSANHQAQVIEVLKEQIQSLDPLVEATALYALEQIDPIEGDQQARQLLKTTSPENWLVRETAGSFLGEKAPTKLVRALLLEIKTSDHTETRVFHDPIVHIGRSQLNEIVLTHPQVSQRHAILTTDTEGVNILDLDSPGVLYVNNQVIENTRYRLKQGDEVRFSHAKTPAITIHWEDQPVRSSTPVEALGTLEKLLAMVEINLFQTLNPDTLIELARKADIRRYQPGDTLFSIGDPAEELHFMIEGEAEVTVPQAGNAKVINRIRQGQSIGEMGVLSHKIRSADVVTVAEINRILVISAEDFESILRTDSEFSRRLLLDMIDRLQRVTTQAMQT